MMAAISLPSSSIALGGRQNLARAHAETSRRSGRSSCGLVVRAEKPCLYDVPVSNNGAKVRLVMYKKGLEDVIDRKAPADLGGLKSDGYLAINPMGKMPVLSLPGGDSIPESQVIIHYILDKYHNVGPSLIPVNPELRAKAALIPHVLDTYIGSVQGAMYRGPMDIEVRAAQIKAIADGLDYLERLMVGPYAAGDELSFGDLSIFPTFVFMVHMLPNYFGWESVFKGRPKLEAWWGLMLKDPEAKRVHGEIMGGLNSWAEAGRWDTTGISDHVKDTAHQWAY